MDLKKKTNLYHWNFIAIGFAVLGFAVLNLSERLEWCLLLTCTCWRMLWVRQVLVQFIRAFSFDHSYMLYLVIFLWPVSVSIVSPKYMWHFMHTLCNHTVIILVCNNTLLLYRKCYDRGAFHMCMLRMNHYWWELKTKALPFQCSCQSFRDLYTIHPWS